MKKLLLIPILLFILSIFAYAPVFAINQSNLLKNDSVETMSGDSPEDWTTNKWGTNSTVHTYKTDGHTGGRSLYTSMSGRVDGDAKWMHTAVAAKANTSYTYSSWYKSNTTTEIDIQYINTAGVTTYVYVGWLPASTEWQQFSMEFITPADVAQMTVMHIIASNGWVQTDDFALIETPLVTGDDDNFIANGTFETASISSPAAWNTNTWGANTATFTYNTTGRNTGRSATVAISNYTSGDAKWYADPVTVVGGKSYLYRDYYKATVDTRVVAAFIDANGNYTYSELSTAKSANDWTQYNVTLAVPTNTVKATVFHLIDRVGSLTIDDVSLNAALPPSASNGPVIPNPSMEVAQNNIPTNWQPSGWGTNTASYTYENEGHDSAKSTKVTVSKYTDGDAKWFFSPISNLKVGSQYRFTAWYKTNVTPHPVAMFIMADGTERYFGMPIAQPASNSTTVWQKYSDVFSVPEGAVSGSVFMFINKVGWLQTDDYSLSEYSPTGFARPLLTLTFDDGHEDNTINALPILKQYGFKTTQCYATQFIEGQSKTIINGVKAFYANGHEICSHTVTHPFLTTMTGANLTYELSHSKTYLQTLTGGTPVRNFSTPYGDYDAKVITEIKKYYQSHRSVDEGFNSKDNFNAYNIRVQNILDTTSAAQVSAWIAQAQADNTWLVLVYHRVADDPGPYDSYISDFKAQMSAVKASGIQVKTYQDAFTEVSSQVK